MATTTTDDGFHEIQLNGKQLVFLFMAATVVSVVIFLCGVLVGRGVRGDGGAVEALVASQDAVVPAPSAPTVVSPPGSAPPATASEDLSYPKRLAGDPPKEQLREGSPAASPPAATQPPPVAASAPPPSSMPPTATPQVATPAPASSAPTPSAAKPPAPAVAAEPSGAGFAIQLAALRQRDEADGIARRLTNKGYAAYVMTPDAGAPAVFRVRVGKFKERREAEAVAARLQKEEQFNPWIVR